MCLLCTYYKNNFCSYRVKKVSEKDTCTNIQYDDDKIKKYKKGKK